MVPIEDTIMTGLRNILRAGLIAIAGIIGLASSATADIQVNELRLARNQSFTELTIPVPGRFLCDHMIEEPKNGRPFRVVIDVCNAVHQLPQMSFPDIPSEVIRRIRTSQYAVTPENIVRVVLDLSHEVTYKISTTDSSLVISLVAPDEPAFMAWSTGLKDFGPSPAETSEPASFWAQQQKDGQQEQTPPATAKPVPAADDPGHTAEDMPSPGTLAQGDTPNVLETKPVAPPVPVGPTQQEHEPVETEDAPTPVLVDHSYTPAEAAAMGPKWIPPRPEDQSAEPAELAETDEVTDSSLVDEQQTLAGDTTDTGVVIAGEDVIVEPPPVVVEKPAEEKLPLLVRLKRKFFGEPQSEKVNTDPASQSDALARIRELETSTPPEEDELAQGTDTDKSSTRTVDTAELAEKIATADPSVLPRGSLYAATNGQAAPADEPLVLAPKDGQSGAREVQLDPNRTEVNYQRRGRRDPFEPLIHGQRSGLWTAQLPRVDALRLVGILEDYDGRIALCEDMEGYGYILHQGDPVRNGSVKLIGPNRAVFEVDDYGWVHTVVLELRQDGVPVGDNLATEFEEEE